MRFAWVFGIVAMLLTGFAIGLPLIYQEAFGAAAPSGTLDAPAVFGTMIGLLAVAVAAFGIGTWKLLEQRVTDVAQKQSTYTAAVSLVVAARNSMNEYIFELEEETKIAFSSNAGVEHSVDRENRRWQLVDEGFRGARWLNSAIDLLESAAANRTHFADDPNASDLYYRIANNLAFCLTERGQEEDQLPAEAYAAELTRNLDNFPNKKKVWSDTISAVNSRWA